ncbi:MAG: class I SAM-dependent methyltransferase [Chloroflexota bacterium]
MIAYHYDLLYGDRDDDLEMWLALTEDISGPILEVGCGTGRVFVPLLQHEKRITGIDISQQALQIVQEKVTMGGFVEQAQLHQADMRNFALPEQNFAFAFVPINTLMHCETTADQINTLRAIHNHLHSDGILVLDLFNPTPHRLLEADGQLILEGQQVDMVTNNTIQWYVSRRLEVDQQLEDVTFILDEIQEDGILRRGTLSFSLRYVHRFEAELLLSQTGFELQEIYGDYDLSLYDKHSPRLILVAKKR